MRVMVWNVWWRFGGIFLLCVSALTMFFFVLNWRRCLLCITPSILSVRGVVSPRALTEIRRDLVQAIEPKITKDVLGVLSVESSVKSRTSFGGTAPKNVTSQAKSWLKRLEKERKLG